MSDKPQLGHAAFFPYGNGPLWSTHYGAQTGYSIRSIICTDEEFEYICRQLAGRRAASVERPAPDQPPPVPNYEDLED